MAETFGFEGFKTAAQVRQEEMAAFQNRLAQGDKNSRRATTMVQAAQNLTGSQAYREAKKTEAVMQGAAQAVGGMPAADDLQAQEKYFREAQRLAVEAELPAVAMQATQNLAQLQVINEERARLKAKEEREVAEERRTQEAFELEMDVAKVNKRHLTNGMLVDPQTLEVKGRYDMTNPEDVAAMTKLKQGSPGLVFRTESQYVELTEAEKDRLARLSKLGSGIGGRSTLYKDWYKKAQGTNAFATTATDFVDLLMLPDAQQIFGAGGGTKGFIEKAAAHGRSFLGDEGVSAVEGRFAEDARFNALSSEKQALIIELGYALATSREGGRLTDQDVDRAIRTLGVDNPDPRAVAWIFGRALQRNRDDFADSKMTGGVFDIDGVSDTYEFVLESMDEQLGRLSSRYKIDFSDEEQFDKYVDPKGAHAGEQDDRGVVVRKSGGSERKRRRVVN